MSKKYSTKTITPDGKISPWLSASGGLAYTPENPPERDYFFQYSWVLPEVIGNHSEIKRYHYFGHPIRSYSDFLFDFWNQARKGKFKKVMVCYGGRNNVGLEAPIAVYQYKPPYEQDSYLLIQHGSYQVIPIKSQPLIPEGVVKLYCGIGKSKKYKYLKLDSPIVDKKQYLVLERYFDIHEKIFLDSALSFSIAHHLVKRCQTDFLSRENPSWCDIAGSMNFEWEKDYLANNLTVSYLQSFSINKRLVLYKFGPNYIECVTPISNIRLTTFFAGEWEVMVIDSRKVEIVKTIKCKAKAVNPCQN